MLTITKDMAVQPQESDLLPLCLSACEPGSTILPSPADFLFFDIETTGFSAESSFCYLIGCAFFREGRWQYTQWLAELPDQEAGIICAFFSFLKSFAYLVHYNGQNFDIPYLCSRCSQLSLPYTFEGVSSIDIFRDIRLLRNVLNLENYKQKTVEKFAKIARTDKIDGGELINIYREYVHRRLLDEDPDASLLLLHNRDDICALPEISAVLGYCPSVFAQAAACGLIQPESLDCRRTAQTGDQDAEAAELLLRLELPFSLPASLSWGNFPFNAEAHGQNLLIHVQLYSGELKYFYPNYKDYYYLIQEDRALHKSVASYVDKRFRRQAKAADCYTQKSGSFLPQTDAWKKPAFRKSYADTMFYFEAGDAFLNNKQDLLGYAIQILQWL